MSQDDVPQRPPGWSPLYEDADHYVRAKLIVEDYWLICSDEAGELLVDDEKWPLPLHIAGVEAILALADSINRLTDKLPDQAR